MPGKSERYRMDRHLSTSPAWRRSSSPIFGTEGCQPQPLPPTLCGTPTSPSDRKVRAVQDGQAPFYEPGLEALIQSNLRNGRLSATTSTADALRDADFAFL